MMAVSSEFFNNTVLMVSVIELFLTDSFEDGESADKWYRSDFCTGSSNRFGHWFGKGWPPMMVMMRHATGVRATQGSSVFAQQLVQKFDIT